MFTMRPLYAPEGEIPPAGGQEPKPDEQVSPETEPEQDLSADATKAELKRARDEAAKERKRRQAAEAESKKLRDAQDASLKAEAEKRGEFQKLYETEKAERERLAGYESVVRETVEHELSFVPENLRDLVPTGSPTDQLKWVRNAKAKGIFDPPAAPGAPPPKPSPTRGAPPPNGGPKPKAPALTSAEWQEKATTRDLKRRQELAAKHQAYVESL